jgi:uncharacterized membrane protein
MPNPSPRVLFAGESWNTQATHTKGFGSFTTSAYEEGATVLLAALRASGFDVTYLRNHEVAENFPFTAKEISDRFDVVILSDLPADSLLLPHAVFVRGERRPNRLRSLASFAEQGGGLLMIGGYMSFSGIDGRGRYGATPLAAALPVEISGHDDRVEEPEGVNPTVALDHPILAGIAGDWPYFLGYNRFKAKPGAQIVLTVDADPFLVVGHHGAGRVAAFASDCSPHWGSPEFLAWPHYAAFWSRLTGWLTGA